MKISAVLRLARKKFASKLLTKRPYEKHMLEVEKSSVRLYFVRYLQNSLPGGF